MVSGRSVFFQDHAGKEENMKKVLSVLMIALLSVTCIFAAGAKEDAYVSPVEEELPPMKIVSLKGPTSMGLVEMMDENRDGEDYLFTIEAAPTAVVPMVVKGEFDAACIPANLASVLYNKTNGKVQVAGINTLGILYIAENGDSVHSVEDLRGKTIIASGKGATPEYALNYILNAYGLEPGKDVFIEWKAEHAECLGALNANEGAVAMLPQPFLTTGLMKNPSIRVALDLNDLWEEKIGKQLLTGVVIIQKEYAEAHEERVREFLDDYAESVEFVQENRAEAAALIGEFGIFPEKVAFKALPDCNIVFISGEEMKDALVPYLDILAEQNPMAVGGKVPADDFYII